MDGCDQDMEDSKGMSYRTVRTGSAPRGRLEGAGLSEMGYCELRFGFGDET